MFHKAEKTMTSNAQALVTMNGSSSPAEHAPEMYPADIDAIFGVQTFNLDTMRAYLPDEVFDALCETIEAGKPLKPEIADVVALAMKEWAIEHGATHFTHWFQPLTGGTAEKHESFVTPNVGGGAIVKFSGKELIQGEPDASSFPSGGLRTTFEARGYTAWDPSSPAFVMKIGNIATLCIPTAFASWSGEALDYKIPLLRSIEALNTQTLKALDLLGEKQIKKCYPTAGSEQEFFLIDAQLHAQRPDLVVTGRTLIGARPAKSQELADHYFGAIPERVLAYMREVEYRLYRLGVPIKTRHNEVAPNQYEIAPLFEHANISADHQQLIMNILRVTAPKYGLVCLLHEKPFAGINGSGKHLNWSIATNTGLNLLNPGKTPHENLHFLYFTAAVIKAVDQYQGLLRASIASAGNDLRLGGHEAPPAIMSVFLGEQLSEIFDRIVQDTEHPSPDGGLLGLGVPVLPPLPRHSTDRNRTSPLAFTGNKFEFRAVGASQTISWPLTVINTIVADALASMNQQLASLLSSGISLEDALRKILAEIYQQHCRIVFNGDGYSPEWHHEAQKRGLLDLKDTVQALQQLHHPDVIALFERQNVLTQKELAAREEIFLDQYAKTRIIESLALLSLVRQRVLPAAIQYLRNFPHTEHFTTASLLNYGEQLSLLIESLIQSTDTLEQEIPQVENRADTKERATAAADTLLPLMKQIRTICDRIELLVPAQYWTLPTYQEMLFTR